MNKTEARNVLRKDLQKYREEPYETLAEKIDKHDRQVAIGSSGTSYQIDITIFWDSKPGGDLRIMAA